MKKGKVIILVAPSGSGKTTLARRLFKDFEDLKFSVSATTRPPREGEIDKKHYYFLSNDDFERKVADGAFLEWEEFYGGKKYGTLRSEVDKKLNSGYFVLLDIEVKGAVNINKIYGDECLSLFIKPPSIEVLKQRLIDRGTEDDETLALRLERARKELTYADRFDQVIINDDLDTAYDEVKKAVLKFMNQN
ncbi:MAG: guanylate kinase [Balneola sp.]|jgi:guanylate kinase|nr:guanylate kinase [Balneola sp.]MBE80598.1 guanylate kinase [Balneola sp.]MBE80650.1 guanylate kinase [Balneola sp.]HBX67639.1 guanylate kinase [Balneolaceae bacterium]|tara:strand:- start:182 stop:754 length:573 start_codon:yes stop_codon:yes gene_type:complete